MIINKILCMMRLAQCNAIKQGADEQLGGRGRVGNGEWVFSGCRVSFWNDENVLELNSGNGCTTLWSTKKTHWTLWYVNYISTKLLTINHTDGFWKLQLNVSREKLWLKHISSAKFQLERTAVIRSCECQCHHCSFTDCPSPACLGH